MFRHEICLSTVSPACEACGEMSLLYAISQQRQQASQLCDPENKIPIWWDLVFPLTSFATVMFGAESLKLRTQVYLAKFLSFFHIPFLLSSFYVCAHACVCLCVFTYVLMCVLVYLRMCSCVLVCTYICAHVLVCTYVGAHVCDSFCVFHSPLFLRLNLSDMVLPQQA